MPKRSEYIGNKKKLFGIVGYSFKKWEENESIWIKFDRVDGERTIVDTIKLNLESYKLRII